MKVFRTFVFLIHLSKMVNAIKVKPMNTNENLIQGEDDLNVLVNSNRLFINDLAAITDFGIIHSSFENLKICQ